MTSLIQRLGEWDLENLTVEDLVVGGVLTSDGETFVEDIKALLEAIGDEVEGGKV